MKIAFNTANLVARVTGYRFSLAHWGDQHTLTIARTDERAFETICAEIAGAGFKAVEIWQAHADPSVMTRTRASTMRAILDAHELEPVAYAGSPTEAVFEICQWLGIPLIAGGLGGESIEAVTQRCRATGVVYGYENHPEKTVAEIRGRIQGGEPEWCGVALDLGWLGTQGGDAVGAIADLGPLVRHVHVKDVRAAGGHETVPLGDGVVQVDNCLKALRKIGYEGVYSWEDEPEDRNPFAIARSSREWLESRLQ